MSDLKFEVGKLYKTRGGEVRRVVCVDAPGEHPVVSVRVSVNSSPYPIAMHLSDGRLSGCEGSDAEMWLFDSWSKFYHDD
jgi:hypothetical protein